MCQLNYTILAVRRPSSCKENSTLLEGRGWPPLGVDEYEGSISGLIIAEVELDSEDQEVIVPDWVGLELTHLKGWSNSALSRMIMDSELN